MIRPSDILKLNLMQREEEKPWTPKAMAYVQYKLILRTLRFYKGNRKETARSLDIPWRRLESDIREMKQLGITIPKDETITRTESIDAIIQRQIKGDTPKKYQETDSGEKTH